MVRESDGQYDERLGGRLINRRIDPARDKRRLALFFGGLIIFYVGILLIIQPELNGGEVELNKIAFGVMLAPTVGAVLACVFGPGIIRFGVPSWWLLAGFLPAALVFLITMVAVPVSDAVTFHTDKVASLLLMAVIQSLLGCITALGEEIGWRGFLWPLMRRRLTFFVSSVIMVAVWWIYHAGLTFAGWYGFNGGIPAFSVGLVGFVLFVGVLTERSRSVWPSVLAHGSWNGLVQSYFSSSGAVEDRVFTGSRYLLGEFGWLAAAGMLILGVTFAWWHLRTPTRDGLSPKEPTAATRHRCCGCGSATPQSTRPPPKQRDLSPLLPGNDQRPIAVTESA
jgi:membrane protease YdiL (CAAX protease family)